MTPNQQLHVCFVVTLMLCCLLAFLYMHVNITTAQLLYSTMISVIGAGVMVLDTYGDV